MVAWGVVSFVWREPLFRLSMRWNLFVREGGCLYELNRLLAYYVMPPAFALFGFVLAVAGLVGAAC